MGKRADRLAAQTDLEREWTRQQAARPNESESGYPVGTVLCAVGRGPCDFTMRGRDGIRRCWYCARRKP